MIDVRQTDVALYIEACIEEDPGDGSLIQAGLADVARARGLERLAANAGLSVAALEQALARGPGQSRTPCAATTTSHSGTNTPQPSLR